MNKYVISCSTLEIKNKDYFEKGDTLKLDVMDNYVIDEFDNLEEAKREFKKYKTEIERMPSGLYVAYEYRLDAHISMYDESIDEEVEWVELMEISA